MRFDFPLVTAGLLTAFIAAPLSAQTLLEKARRDEIVRVPDNDADMKAAFQKARSTLEDFLSIAREARPSITNYAVKIPVRGNGSTEYFWISRFTESNGRLVGRIDNNPRMVDNVKIGQLISFKKTDVVDWLYRENGKMIGNYTGCVLIKHEPPEDVEALKQRFGFSCD